ncbi:MAG: flagellar hook-length control protein FliK [Gammaproteobacteria bacterium]|nr:flagellar hook-length control protein FliK [Gammaproteobacteria bacterium]MBU1480875.1 flagellar hook-length control protein FliK [Gammaproteobacteria bacterium]
MTSLPITTNAPQNAAPSKQTANTAETGDAQNSPPFGEVLARQISDPSLKDTKANGKLGVDALAQLATDTGANKIDAADDKKTNIAATDGTSVLPTDMLAALMPQGMNTSNASTPGADASAKSDRTEIGTDTTQGRRDVASTRADAAAGTVKADATLQAATGAQPGAQAKERSFAATVTESANRPPAAGMELKTVVREAIALAAQKPDAVPQANAAALASLQNPAANVAAPAIQPVQVTINTPVNQSKWRDEFSQKITWLASSDNKNQTAELHLNPPKLGPLDVVIKVSGDQATAQFTSPHAAVREAVELAMPRLREMLADSGIMLGNATVSDQAPRDQGQSGTQRASDQGNSIQDTPAASNSTARVSPISRHNGIVDTFA